MDFAFLRRRLAGLAIATSIGLAGLAAIAGHAPARALTNCDVADLSMDSQETAFLTLINQYRAQSGLSALSVSTNLNRAASWKAVDLATNNYFSHTDSLGRAPAQLSVDCGYPTGSGENLAAGTVWDTAQEAFDAWKASAGHNANMLTTYYQQIGIARYYNSASTYSWYWVTEFGTSNDGTSGTGATATANATNTPAPATAAKAAITSPADGSTLSGSTATFSWSAGSGALEYFLYAGSSQGANNYYGASQGTATSRSIASLPTDGSTVYVRLWTRFSTGWLYADYSYRAATSAGTTTTTKANLVAPTPGSVIPAVNANFGWTAASGGLEYFLYVGTSQGSNDRYGQSQGTSTSRTISQLSPYSGTTWVRLWTRTAAGWTFTDYSFAGIR